MVGQGLVASVAHPGGNTTGISILATEFGSKRQEILMEMVPDNFDSDADEAIAGRTAVSGSARKAICLCKFTR